MTFKKAPSTEVQFIRAIAFHVQFILGKTLRQCKPNFQNKSNFSQATINFLDFILQLVRLSTCHNRNPSCKYIFTCNHLQDDQICNFN